jgi:hypothetical protein
MLTLFFGCLFFSVISSIVGFIAGWVCDGFIVGLKVACGGFIFPIVAYILFSPIVLFFYIFLAAIDTNSETTTAEFVEKVLD